MKKPRVITITAPGVGTWRVGRVWNQGAWEVFVIDATGTERSRARFSTVRAAVAAMAAKAEAYVQEVG